MTQIRINTEQVKAVGRQFDATGNHLTEIGHELQRAISSLDTSSWDGVSRQQTEPLLGQVRPASERVAGELDELGRMLVRVAETFEQEDNTAAHDITDWSLIDSILFPGPGWRFPLPIPGWPFPWPPRYWPWVPILPILPILPPWFRPPWRWPRPGIPKPILPGPLPIPKPEPAPEPPPQPTPPSPLPGIVIPPGGVGSDKRPWSYVDAPAQCDEGNRSPGMYNQVLDQFCVADNVRYKQNQQGKNETYCNIYVWDATRAMGAEIPHWVDANGGPVPQGQGRELSANGSIGWLETHGQQAGWRAVSAEQAQTLANEGKPAVATYKNPSGIGHVAMVRPGDYSVVAGPTIAQAGGKNFNDGTVQDGFGNRPVVYYVHT